MRDKKISIIIISYNVKNKLIKCINSLQPSSDQEIIVIDNNSDDDSFNAIESISKKYVCVKNEKNIGFAKAVNQGIKLSQGEYILLLNPDTIPKQQAIRKLINYLNVHHDCGLVGGKLVKPKKKGVHGTYVNKPNFLTAIFEFTNLKKIFPNNVFSKAFYYKEDSVITPKLVFGLSGGFLLIRKNILNEIGLFDENFFMYLEDVDFGIRVRKNHYKVIYLPDAQIIHDSGSSSKHSIYNINVDAWRKSKKYFFQKHLSFYQSIIISIIFSLDDLLTDLIHILQRKPLR